MELNSHLQELLELRKQFEKVDTKDPAAVRKWFADYSYLSTAELAQVVGKSRWYIRNLKRQNGLTKPPPAILPISTRRPKQGLGIEVPSDWDTKEWLEKAVRLHSINQISKAVGLTRPRITIRLERYGIDYKSARRFSNNPCCNKAWIYKYYVEMSLNQSQCSKLAGISVENFANWLVKFQIPVRRQRTGAAAPLWVYQLHDKLNEIPIIRSVYLRPDHIHVRFLHYIWESYYPDRTGKRLAMSYNITKEDIRLEHIPTISHQYESELDGTNRFPHHIQVNIKEWRKASFMERRMALHAFGKRIFDNKYQQLEHPAEIIGKEWSDIKLIDTDKFMRKSGFITFGRFGYLGHSPGKRIVEHFFDLSELWNGTLTSPRYITHTLNNLVSEKLTINTHNLLTILLTGFDMVLHKKRPNIPTPLVYASIFKRLDIKGAILDLHTGFGERAAACALLGLPYYYIQNPSFTHALDRGYADFLGLDQTPHNGDKIELLICDSGLRELPDLGQCIELAKYAKHMLIFVPRQKRKWVLEKLPPRSAIPIRTRFYQKAVDYFFLY